MTDLNNELMYFVLNLKNYVISDTSQQRSHNITIRFVCRLQMENDFLKNKRKKERQTLTLLLEAKVKTSQRFETLEL